MAVNGVLQVENVKVNAIVLRTADYLENDKILTLLTAERGKITAGIKGVKKAGAKLKFAAQPFCFAEYILAERAGRYTVVQASECESFYELRGDVNKYYAACAVCETASALTVEGGGNEVFSLCVKALTSACGQDEAGDEALALITFLLAVLKCAGYGVDLSGCSECHKSLKGADKLRFDMSCGAFTCWDCGTGLGASGATYSTLCAAAGLEGEITAEGKKRALKLLKEYVVYNTGAKLNSLNDYIQMM